MRISTKGRSAVNAMIDLALREPNGPVSLATISARLEVSLSYLEQIFAGLRQHGLVKSARGPGGGYTLARDAASISVADIVRSVEPPAAPDVEEGPSRPLWEQLEQVVFDHLAGVTLESLLAEQRERGIAIEPRQTRRPMTALGFSTVKRERERVSAPNSVFAFGRSFLN